MKALMRLLIACAIVGVMSADALAGGGGGGAKDDGKIRVRNDQPGYVLLVMVDPPASLTLTQFLNSGGQIVQPNNTAEFSVAAGNHTVYGILVNDATLAALTPGSKTVSVVKQQTTNVTATNVGGATTLN